MSAALPEIMRKSVLQAETPVPTALGTKVLVIDDQPFSLSLIVRLLEQMGYQAHTLSDGLMAWELLQQTYFPIVICDWNMPGMSGIDLCRRVREQQNPLEYVYFILLTGRTEEEDYTDSMLAGADDFLIKPADPKILLGRLKAGERIIKLQQDLAERNQSLASANESTAIAYSRLESELTAAAQFQTKLLPQPQCFFNRLLCHAVLLPSAFVSGDVVNYFALAPDGTSEASRDYAMGFYVLDVAGHGVRAALSSFMLGRQLQADRFWTETMPGPDLAQMLEYLNVENQLSESRDYFTIAAGVIDCRESRLYLSLAGHPQPILQLPGGKPSLVGEPDPPIGVLSKANYKQISLPFTRGARLLLYSDGVTECMSPSNEALFGTERLCQIMEEEAASPQEQLLERIQSELKSWHEDGNFGDDISIMVVTDIEE